MIETKEFRDIDHIIKFFAAFADKFLGGMDTPKNITSQSSYTHMMNLVFFKISGWIRWMKI